MEKLKNQITINLNDESAALVQKLAEIYQRKPAELVRLLVVPRLCDLWAEVQRQEHPENRAPFQPVRW